jgi:hypothetical protein
MHASIIGSDRALRFSRGSIPRAVPASAAVVKGRTLGRPANVGRAGERESTRPVLRCYTFPF